MVYCDLIEKDDRTATYSYSCGYGKKGVIVFPLKSPEAYIIKKKAEVECGKHWIEQLYFKYYNDFLSGIAKDKIAYEC